MAGSMAGSDVSHRTPSLQDIGPYSYQDSHSKSLKNQDGRNRKDTPPYKKNRVAYCGVQPHIGGEPK